MRFRYGPAPVSVLSLANPTKIDLLPINTAIRNGLFAAAAICVAFAVYLAALSELGPLWLWFADQSSLDLVWAALLLIPLHELLHVAAFPGAFSGKSAVLGCLPGKGAFYAFCDRPMPRDRWLLVMAVPFVVLSVLPLLALPWMPELRIAAPVAILNCFGSGVDLVYGWAIFRALPKDSWIQQSESSGFWSPELLTPSAP